jgi:RimJ/RimL family protein N-acetyltransferase
MDILLREVIDSDLPIFYQNQADPIAYQMAAYPSKDWESFLAHWKNILADETNRFQTIVYQGQVAGNVLSFLMDGKREVGYWLGREFWGKGIATQALALFLQQEQTRPLYGVVIKHNAASKRVLENCGFHLQAEEAEQVIFILVEQARENGK